jgi:hypothetical protein
MARRSGPYFAWCDQALMRQVGMRVCRRTVDQGGRPRSVVAGWGQLGSNNCLSAGLSAGACIACPPRVQVGVLMDLARRAFIAAPDPVLGNRLMVGLQTLTLPV